MTQISRHLSVACAVGMSVLGCSGAEGGMSAAGRGPDELELDVSDAPADAGRDSQHSADTAAPDNDDYPSDDDDDASAPPHDQPDSDGAGGSSASAGGTGGLPTASAGSASGGSAAGGSHNDGPACDCAVPVPGVVIARLGASLKIGLELLDEPLTIEVLRGSGRTSEAGLAIEGDVKLELDGTHTLTLLGAKLNVDSAQNGLDLRADAEALSGIDASALPLASKLIDLRHVHVSLEPSDAASKLLKLSGSLAVGEKSAWDASLPLVATSMLTANAWISHGSAARVALAGDVGLALDRLRSEQHPLSAVTLARAAIVLGSDGVSVRGRLTSPIDLRLKLLDSAQLTVKFSAHAGGWEPTAPDWSINLSDTQLLGPLAGVLQSLDCLNIDVSGFRGCRD